MNSLPFGSVTRRDGVLNVAAHYPTNANPPDLGPKGYFSEISDDEPGGNGSTKLHMVSLHSLGRAGERGERRADVPAFLTRRMSPMVSPSPMVAMAPEVETDSSCL